MKLKQNMVLLLLSVMSTTLFAQKKDPVGPASRGYMSTPVQVESIAKQLRDGVFIHSENGPERAAPPKRRLNNIVPGKGSNGPDPVLQTNPPTRVGGGPTLVFDADTTPQAGVTDPTGAIGPNHYIAAWNFGFRIFDRNGDPLTPEASLATIFPGNAIGDPIVLYDELADRFVITEFDSSPNGFNVAVSQGPDPVNDGWHVYTTGFGTGAFPDYTKFSIWPDGYYVTANIGSSNRVFAVEREKMINGEDAQFVGFQLPGIDLPIGGFYSPQGFSVTGGSHPEPGNFSVVYMQDDAWNGVDEDHLKIWTLNVDWLNTANSTSSQPQEIPTADFIATFDNGSFSNLEQPNGISIDALQATVMNQAQFRQFLDYNSVVFNFVVDTDATAGELAGIRWFELRQTASGEPWTIFQEGTYTAPDGRHAFQGSMAMDIYGNIGMGYSSVSTTDMISIRYTGRLNGDTPGDMTFTESLIAQSTANNPGVRFADYVHLTVDPVDDRTYWHIAEYFNTNRRDVVGVFNLANPLPGTDVAIVEIIPDTGNDLTVEDITVTIENYGTATVTNVPVSYSIDGSTPVEEIYTGSIGPGETDTYTFTVPFDFTGFQTYRIETRTALVGDEVEQNDYYGENLTNSAVLSAEDLEFSNAELQVLTKDHKNFDILLRTSYDDIIPMQVYDTNGKSIAFNNLINEGNRFTYRLNMSYMASGLYLIKIGEGKLQKSAKIIVK